MANIPCLDANLGSAAALEPTLQDYVRGSIERFAIAFAAEVAPHLSQDEVRSITARLLQPKPTLPRLPAVPGLLQPPAEQLALVFFHDCSALGCRDRDCTLCQYNPHRICERNFQRKYLVGDSLKATCGEPIRIQLLEPSSRAIRQQDLQLQVAILDGVAFKEKGGDGHMLPFADLAGCIKSSNHREEALLQFRGHPGGGGGGAPAPLRTWMRGGTQQLPDVTVTDSSEALLSGRRPPFRLMVWAVDALGNPLPHVHPVISEDFVVATRRVKQANKVEIPLMDDPVNKIEHIGKETVKKLGDMRAAASECAALGPLVERLPAVETVGQFVELVRLAETDGQLQKALQLVLKLSKEKWEEAAAHAVTAVVPDFRRRMWYPPGPNLGVGLVFGCRYGEPALRDTISLAQTSSDGSVKVVAEDQLDPGSLAILRTLKATAIKKWSEPRHPGWGILREPPTAPPPPAAAPGFAAAGLSARLAPGACVPQQLLGSSGQVGAGAAGLGSLAPGVTGGVTQGYSSVLLQSSVPGLPAILQQQVQAPHALLLEADTPGEAGLVAGGSSSSAGPGSGSSHQPGTAGLLAAPLLFSGQTLPLTGQTLPLAGQKRPAAAAGLQLDRGFAKVLDRGGKEGAGNAIATAAAPAAVVAVGADNAPAGAGVAAAPAAQPGAAELAPGAGMASSAAAGAAGHARKPKVSAGTTAAAAAAASSTTEAAAEAALLAANTPAAVAAADPAAEAARGPPAPP